MTRTFLAIAAILALLPLAAAAQTPPPAPEKPRPPRPGVRVPGPRPHNPALTLTWFGQSAFVISSPTGARVLIDPFAAEIGLPLPAEKLEVDAVAVTHEHPDHTNVAGFVSDKPLVLRGLAGDDWAKVQENVKGVRISTVPSFHDAEEGKQRGKTAIFVFEMAGFRIAHLDAFGQARLTPEQQQAGFRG